MISLDIPNTDWQNAKQYWSEIKDYLSSITESKNDLNPQIKFIERFVFGNPNLTVTTDESINIPSVKSIDNLMDEIENDIKTSKNIEKDIKNTNTSRLLPDTELISLWNDLHQNASNLIQKPD